MVPARRKSKATKRSRRAHHALKPVQTIACPRCNQAKLPHAACENCGYVNQRYSLKQAAEEK